MDFTIVIQMQSLRLKIYIEFWSPNIQLQIRLNCLYQPSMLLDILNMAILRKYIGHLGHQAEYIVIKAAIIL